MEKKGERKKGSVVPEEKGIEEGSNEPYRKQEH